MDNIIIGFTHWFFFSFVGLFILRMTNTHVSSLRFQTILFLWSSLIRFLASVAIYEGGLVDTLKDEDGGGWVIGISYAAYWANQGRTLLDIPNIILESYSLNVAHRGYYHLLATLFFITGQPNRLAAAAVNSLAGALTVVLVYRVARSIFLEEPARTSGWLCCFFPSLIIWTSQTVKEPVVILLETIVIYCCVRIRTDFSSLRHLLLGVFSALLLYPFRFYACYLSLATIVTSILIPRFQPTNSLSAPIAIATIFLVGFTFISGNQLTSEIAQQQFDLRYIEQFRENVTVGDGSGSAVRIDGDIRTPTGFLYVLIIGGLHLLLAPFPWQWSSGTRMLLVIPEVIVWWILLFIGIMPGMRWAISNRFSAMLPLWMLISGMGILYSLMFGNVGLAYRQRAQLLPWMLILCAIGLSLRSTGTNTSISTKQ